MLVSSLENLHSIKPTLTYILDPKTCMTNASNLNNTCRTKGMRQISKKIFSTKTGYTHANPKDSRARIVIQ